MVEFTPGSTIAGYRIDGVLGRGGMGVVYRATQLSLDRPVALKVLSSGLVHEPRFRERFLSEARLAASLSHPNVLPVYEVGEAGGDLFLALRLVEGDDLGAVLVRAGRLAPERVAAIAAQVGAALDAAHARQLVHRDVKPSNVLLERHRSGEHAYLADFGIAKAYAGSTKGLTVTGTVIGTADYLPPEQISRGETAPAGDVYSLACTLHELLTGSVPFPRDGEVAKLWAHATEPPPRLGPEFPDALADALQRSLSKDPEARHRSAGELAAAVALAVEPAMPPAADVPTRIGIPPAAATVTRPAPVPSAPRRGRRRAAVAGVVAVATIGGGIAAGVLVTRDEPDRPPPTPEAAPSPPAPPAPATPPETSVTAPAVEPPTPPTASVPRPAEPPPAEPPPLTVSAGQLALTVPADWVAAADGGSLGLDDAVSLVPPDGSGGLVAGWADAADPSLLPQSIRARLAGDPAEATRVEVGGREALLYRDIALRAGDGAVDVLALPAGPRVALVVCRVADERFDAPCAAAAASATLGDAPAGAIGPSEAFARRVDGVIARFDRARVAQRVELAEAASAAGQASASTAIARAARTAAQAVGAAGDGIPRPFELIAATNLERALRRVATAYDRLAAAARASDRAAWAEAARSVRAGERALQRLIAQLGAYGYEIR